MSKFLDENGVVHLWEKIKKEDQNNLNGINIDYDALENKLKLSTNDHTSFNSEIDMTPFSSEIEVTDGYEPIFNSAELWIDQSKDDPVVVNEVPDEKTYARTKGAWKNISSGIESVIDKKEAALTGEARFNGMGRINLPKNIITLQDESTINILTGDMINKENTIYVIQYDFDLNNESIQIPFNCALRFEGGSLNNGTIKFNNTYLIGDVNFHNIIADKTLNDKTEYGLKENYISADWFNLSELNDCSIYLQSAVNLLKNIGGTLEFSGKVYNVKHLDINGKEYSNISFIGHSTIIKQLIGEKIQKNWPEYKGRDGTYGRYNSADGCFTFDAYTGDKDQPEINDDNSIKNILLDGLTFVTDVVKYGFDELLHQVCCHGVSGFRVNNCNFIGFLGDGLCISRGLKAGGKYPDPEPWYSNAYNKDVFVTNCNFDGINKNNRQGISFYHCNTWVVDKCNFKNTTREDMPGAIDSEPDSENVDSSNGIVSSCTFENIGGNGCICIVSRYVPKLKPCEQTNYIITNCKFKNVNSTLQAVMFDYQDFHYYNYNGNYIIDMNNCNAEDIRKNMLNLTRCAGVYIHNCRFVDMLYPKVVTWGGKKIRMENCLIKDIKPESENIIYGVDFVGWADPKYDSPMDDIEFIGNTIDNCGYYGLMIRQSQNINITIENNHFKNCSKQYAIKSGKGSLFLMASYKDACSLKNFKFKNNTHDDTYNDTSIYDFAEHDVDTLVNQDNGIIYLITNKDINKNSITLNMGEDPKNSAGQPVPNANVKKRYIKKGDTIKIESNTENYIVSSIQDKKGNEINNDSKESEWVLILNKSVSAINLSDTEGVKIIIQIQQVNHTYYYLQPQHITYGESYLMSGKFAGWPDPEYLGDRSGTVKFIRYDEYPGIPQEKQSVVYEYYYPIGQPAVSYYYRKSVSSEEWGEWKIFKPEDGNKLGLQTYGTLAEAKLQQKYCKAGFQFFARDQGKSGQLIIWNGSKWITNNGEYVEKIIMGSTDQRPTQINDGYQYFDTTYKKIIWFYDGHWYDSNGAIVQPEK